MYKQFLQASKHGHQLKSQSKCTPEFPRAVSIRGGRRRVRSPTPANSFTLKKNHGRSQERSRGRTQTTSTVTYDLASSFEFDASASFSMDETLLQAGSSEGADGRQPRKYLPGGFSSEEGKSNRPAELDMDASEDKISQWLSERSEYSEEEAKQSGEPPVGKHRRREKRIAGNINRLLNRGSTAGRGSMTGVATRFWRGAAKSKHATPVQALTDGDILPKDKHNRERENSPHSSTSSLKQVLQAEVETDFQTQEAPHKTELQECQEKLRKLESRMNAAAEHQDHDTVEFFEKEVKKWRTKTKDLVKLSTRCTMELENLSLSASHGKRKSPWPGSPASKSSSPRQHNAWTAAAASLFTEVQKMANRKLRTRIHAFDRRYLKSLSRARSQGTALNAGDNSSNEHEHEPAHPRVSTKHVHGDHHPVEATLASMEKEVKETPLEYTVVRWSSQRPEYPASDLTKTSGTGRWETAPLHVRNEYIVMELRGQHPRTVTSIIITLPGTDAGPKQCRVFYSTSTADGPWREAWRFEVKCKDQDTFKANHDFGGHMDEFKDLLERQCGCIEDAWHLLLDVNGDGRLSYIEFAAACNRLRQMPGVAKHKCHFFEDLQRLFEALDVDTSGTVGLDDLQRKDHKMPEAIFWKLSVTNNWGSTLTTAIAAPLTLMTLVDEKFGGVSNLQSRLSVCRHEDEIDLLTAFQLPTLGVSEDTIMLRHLAQEYDLPLNTIEDIFDKFGQVDSNHNGKIEKSEFDSMILRLHGAKEASDMPQGRLKFFWQQADKDGDGEIDFEEFLVWFSRYFCIEGAEVNLKANNIAGSFYAGFGGAGGQSKSRASIIANRRESHLDKRKSSISPPIARALQIAKTREDIGTQR